jgi:hypothetical protein
MRFRFIQVCVLVLIATSVSADSWRWRESTTIYKFKDGLRFEYRVRPFDRGYQARVDVTIKNGAVLLGHYTGIGFEDLIASPDERIFVGLSNSGLPGTAVVVFDPRGDMLLHADHGTARFDYCDESITIMRVWHGSAKSDVWFDEAAGVAGVSLIDCHGKRVNLLQTVSEAYTRGLAEYGEWQKRKGAGGQ